MILRTTVLLILIALAHCTAGATALRKDRPTDDSVCDFGHNTSAALEIIGFVPWDTRNMHEVYARMIISWAVANCRDGQTLLIDATYGELYEDRYAGLATLRLCKAADIRRSPKATVDHPQAFEQRCTISKLSEAKAWSTSEDSKQSIDSMILERSGSLQRGGKPREDSKNSPTDKWFDTTVGKCAGKSSLASILFGGSCQKQ